MSNIRPGQLLQPDEDGRVWPKIPVTYQEVPPHLENVVKEVKFICRELRKLAPTPLPTDDLKYYSDLVQSLETRNDITWRVMRESEPEKIVSFVVENLEIEHDEHKIKERLKRLNEHWTAIIKPLDILELEDVPIAPIKEADDSSPLLRWTDEQKAEMEREFLAFKKRKAVALSYFRLHPPVPMAWAPLYRESIPNTTPEQRARGLLYDRRDWKPIYRSWELEDVPLMWQDPENPEPAQTEEEQKQWFERYRKERKEKEARERQQQEQLKAIRERRARANGEST